MWLKWLLSVTITCNTSARSDSVSAKIQQLGWYLQQWWQDWTIAMQHWLVYHRRLLHHYNKSRTQLLVWSSSWALVSMRLCYGYTGHQHAGTSSSGSVASWIQSSMGRVQHIWPTLLSPSLPAGHILPFDRRHKWISQCHGCAQSSVTVCSHTPVTPHGTHCLKICIPW